MAVKKQAKEQTLEDKLWDTAELLRGKVSPTSYKDIALGLLFLKFISYWFDQRREEIIETYVETYMNKFIPKKLLNTNENKSTSLINVILASMTLNPLALPALYIPKDMTINKQEISISEQIPNIILDVFNNHKDRKIIATAELDDSFIEKYLKIEQNQNKKLHIDSPDKVLINRLNNNIYKTQLMEEVISTTPSLNEFTGNEIKFFTLKRYFQMTDNYKIKLDEYGNTHTAQITTGDVPRLSRSYRGYIESDIQPFQHNALIAIHIINRLIMLRRFDILEQILERIVDLIINDHIREYINKINSQQELRYILQQYGQPININDTIEILKKKCIDIAKYDYIKTPYEGVYINENIIGMIEYLSKKLTHSDEGFVKTQNKDLDFSKQQQLIREWIKTRTIGKNRSLYEEINQNIVYKSDSLNSTYDIFRTIYKSDHIFNKEKPIIEDILDYYIKKIDDYKVFYLMTNNDSELKCAHQIKLLNNTKSFIDVIVKSKSD